jgi:hypothetical protein
MNLIERMRDLRVQATTEKSHYYVAKILEEAIAEIQRLQEYEFMYQDLCK